MFLHESSSRRHTLKTSICKGAEYETKNQKGNMGEALIANAIVGGGGTERRFAHWFPDIVGGFFSRVRAFACGAVVGDSDLWIAFRRARRADRGERRTAFL